MDKYRELIAKWRDKAIRWSLAGPTANGQTVDALRYCADELEQALAEPAPANNAPIIAICDRLEKVAEQCEAGGHSSRGKMLRALADEFAVNYLTAKGATQMKYEIVWKDSGKPFDNDLYPPLEDETMQRRVCADAQEDSSELMGKIEVRPAVIGVQFGKPDVQPGERKT
jgi:hypothetical protein